MIVGQIYGYREKKPKKHWRRWKVLRLYDDSGLWSILAITALLMAYGVAGTMDYNDAVLEAQGSAQGN